MSGATLSKYPVTVQVISMLPVKNLAVNVLSPSAPEYVKGRETDPLKIQLNVPLSPTPLSSYAPASAPFKIPVKLMLLLYAGISTEKDSAPQKVKRLK
jgi:hypothetical protein